MIETMHEYHGVGLAAPQVHEGVRLFVAMLDDDPDAKRGAWSSSTRDRPDASAREEGWEGCLSIPDIAGMVPRFTDITVKASIATAKPLNCG
jgi:peptide deformylase